MEANAKIIKEPGKNYAGLITKLQVVVLIGESVYMIKRIKRTTLHLLWVN